MWRKWSLDFKQWSMKYSIVWSLPSNKAGKELSQGCICHSSYPFNTSLSCLLSFYCLLCFIFFDPIYGDEVPSSSLTFSPTVIQCQLRRVLQGKKVYILCALKLWIELKHLTLQVLQILWELLPCCFYSEHWLSLTEKVSGFAEK